MITKIKSDKIVLSDGLFDGYIYAVDGKIERGAASMTFTFAGKTLTLNYEEGKREY